MRLFRLPLEMMENATKDNTRLCPKIVPGNRLDAFWCINVFSPDFICTNTAITNASMGESSVSNVHLACTGTRREIRATTPRTRGARRPRRSLRPEGGSGERPLSGTDALRERWITNVTHVTVANTCSKFCRNLKRIQ